MLILAFLAFTLAFTPAFAQQPATTPAIKALQARVMQEINFNLQCNTNLMAATDEISRLKAELDELRKAKPKE